jgi:hypothetical protein
MTTAEQLAAVPTTPTVLPPATPRYPTAPPAAPTCNSALPPATLCNTAQPQPLAQNEATQNSALRTRHSLNHRQLAALRLLVAGHSLCAAATQLGLSRQTLWRWSRHPAFTAELHCLHLRLLSPPAPSPTAPPPARTSVLPPEMRALIARHKAQLTNNP